MSEELTSYNTLGEIVDKWLKLEENPKAPNFILLFAYNGIGKTRLSMEFKDVMKREHRGGATLYFNAFTEDLFTWDNDLENDTYRILKINSNSKFFNGFQGLALENRIYNYLERYSTIRFKIDYENWHVAFSQEIRNPDFYHNAQQPETIIQDNIKISRGEENIFIWCVYLAICEMAIDGEETYNWVKYLYIDDPISSLDDNNAIAVATDLAQLLRRSENRIKTIISSHHGLFFNVICNELKKEKPKPKQYFFYFDKVQNKYALRETTGTPFFHHIAMLNELKEAADTNKLYTYHFNMLRTILEKTASFFGHDKFSFCLDETDKTLYARALNLLSHGNYAIYQPREMVEDNKILFKNILTNFLTRFEFQLPEILADNTN